MIRGSYDHIYENTTPQQSLTVVSAEDLETKYGAVVQECGDVSWYHLKQALYAKTPPIDVSPGVIAPAFSMIVDIVPWSQSEPGSTPYRP